MPVQIRHAQAKDCPELLTLMQQLAEFEGYREQFAVTLPQLEQRLLVKRDFSVLVAEQQQVLVAMLVFYELPFSYDLSRWLFIKELYVQEQYRGRHIGSKLMAALARHAVALGSTKIGWHVLADNDNAKRFYQALGARAEAKWLPFALSAAQIRALALK